MKIGRMIIGLPCMKKKKKIEVELFVNSSHPYSSIMDLVCDVYVYVCMYVCMCVYVKG